MTAASFGWCKPSQGAKYAGVSLKIFRGWLGAGLHHVRLENNRILVKYRWIDKYLEQFEVRNEAKQLADELVNEL
jgi:hypothetical protein